MAVLTAEEHRRTVERELSDAGFTEAEQAQFMQAWEANKETLTPQWRFLLNRYESFVYRGGP